MSDGHKVLVVSQGGIVDAVFSTEDTKVFKLDWDEVEAENKDYIRQLLKDAKDWPAKWRSQVVFAEVIEAADNLGIKTPEWVTQERNERLLATLADLEA